jgi:hypothetical protein
MSKGALLQLVAKSEIDNYLIDSDLKTSLFQKNVKRITNCSSTPFSFYPSCNINWGDTIHFTINKIGDLLSQIYLVLELPVLSVQDIVGASSDDKNERISTLRIKWNDYIGYNIIENVILKIGGQKIDEMTGEYMQFHSELYDNTSSKIHMMGHDKSLIYPQTRIEKQNIYIPIRFFFCTDISKALPIIALEYHNIEVEIKLREWDYIYLILSRVINIDETTPITNVSKKNFSHTNYTIVKKQMNKVHLECNFIFLDSDERIEMASKRHEILITQTQKLITNCKKNESIYLYFTNPIKELIFSFQRPDYFNLGEIFNYSGKPVYIPLIDDVVVTEITDRLWNQITDTHLLEEMSIDFNGIERIGTRDFKYWHHVMNYENYRSKIDHNLYMYSFGLNAKENMGSCNFSMLDTVRLNIKLSESITSYYHYTNDANIIITGPSNITSVKIYANNYNVLVIESGMGGLMYTV